MEMQFVKHHNECWYVFNAAVVDITGLQEGFLKVGGKIMDMNAPDGLDGSLGTINFVNGAPVWKSNAIGNATCGITDDLAATQLREIADFMERLGVSQESDLGEGYMSERKQKIALWKQRRAYLKETYRVSIHYDRIDDLVAGKDSLDFCTSGSIMIDDGEASWCIELGQDRWYIPTDPSIPTPESSPNGGWAGVAAFDLLLNGGREYRSRADASDIYEAVVDALQERHHPDHCDCDACEERHKIFVQRICEQLREQGLTIKTCEELTEMERNDGSEICEQLRGEGMGIDETKIARTVAGSSDQK